MAHLSVASSSAPFRVSGSGFSAPFRVPGKGSGLFLLGIRF